mmetsp:Transcript_8896/g.21293  ORF Transcript_8896/g.21293 Transcript_8896/m.21293 type:complete len:257 (-) Transcript_8896:52-822(-)
MLPLVKLDPAHGRGHGKHNSNHPTKLLQRDVLGRGESQGRRTPRPRCYRMAPVGVRTIPLLCDVRMLAVCWPHRMEVVIVIHVEKLQRRALRSPTRPFICHNVARKRQLVSISRAFDGLEQVQVVNQCLAALFATLHSTGICPRADDLQVPLRHLAPAALRTGWQDALSCQYPMRGPSDFQASLDPIAGATLAALGTGTSCGLHLVSEETLEGWCLLAAGQRLDSAEIVHNNTRGHKGKECGQMLEGTPHHCSHAA